MQSLLNLMRADCPIIFKYKKSTKAFVIFLILLSIVAGIAAEPFCYSVLALIFAIVFPPMIWQNYGKANMSTLHGILPVSRIEIVRARYLLLGIIITAFSSFTILGMSLSFQIRKLFITDEFSLGMMFGMDLTPFGSMLIYHSFCIVLGYLEIGVGLRSGFRSNFADYKMSFKKMSREEKKKARSNKKEKRIVIAVIFGLYLLLGVFSGLGSSITFVGSIFSTVIGFFKAFAQIANGWLLSLMFILTGMGFLCYQCVCSEIEFEKQEL